MCDLTFVCHATSLKMLRKGLRLSRKAYGLNEKLLCSYFSVSQDSRVNIANIKTIASVWHENTCPRTLSVTNSARKAVSFGEQLMFQDKYTEYRVYYPSNRFATCRENVYEQLTVCYVGWSKFWTRKVHLRFYLIWDYHSLPRMSRKERRDVL